MFGVLGASHRIVLRARVLYSELRVGGNLISAPTTDLQGRYVDISIMWPK
jgi:hypothetical protein